MESPHHHRDQHQHRHRHRTADETDEAAMAVLLDLDAEVLHAYLSEVTAWILELAVGQAPRRILDLGSGTGSGVFALLRRFAAADAIALDRSAYLLSHLEDKARTLGLAGRVTTVRADLDETWPAIEPVDLVWAASSMHHLADPARVLTRIFGTLSPGGLLVVLEIDSFPRFLPDDVGIGSPGLEARCHAALAERRADELPHLGSDWGPSLSQAGFTIIAERPFDIDLKPPVPATARRYAQASLRRLRSGLDGQLSAGDLAALDTLIDGAGSASVLQRPDVSVRATRTAWVARR
jgi:SAM-dependent methyltransferase